MDKKIHLADTSERIRKKYRVKEISVKQQKYKKNQDNHSYSAAPQKSSAEKAKQSENYSTYHNAHKKNTVKNDEARSHYSEDDNSAEKEKYRKQMQYTTFQQKAAEMSKKLSSDIQVNVETSKRQAAVSTYRSEAPSQPKYSDKTKEAAAVLANRLAGDVLYNTHKAAESNAPSNKPQNSPMGNSTPPKSQRVVFYLNSNQKEKARLTKPNNEAIRRFRRAAQNTDKGYLKLDKAIGKQYHKMYKYQEAQRKLQKQAAKPHTSAIEKAEKALYVGGKIATAANKNTAGEAAASLAAVPAELVAKKAIEKASQKHSSIGKMEKAAGAVANLTASIDSQNSIGSAVSSSVTAVPKYYISQKAGEAVKKAATDHYKNKLEKKREALRNKQQKAAEKAEYLKKEQAKRQLKINVYKSEHGVTSNGSTALQNLKAVFKSQQNAAKAAAVAKSSATVIAAAGGAIIPIICIIVVIIVIIALFSWIIPHEENFYNEVDNTWEPVMVETNEEILKGYIKHIQDYFDKKQLEILEVIDINFDGFTPDKYDYAKVEDRGGVLNFEERPKLTTEYTEHYIEKQVQYQEITGYVPGSQNSSGYPIWSETKTKSGESGAIMRTEYYKFDYDFGYEVRTTSLDYDIARTYLLCAIDIEAYWNSQNIKDAGSGGKDSVVTDDDEPLFSCENGKFSIHQDITDEKMVLRKKGAVVYEGSVYTYILSHPELFEHVVSVSIPGSDDSRTCGTSSKWKNRTVTEIISDEQYVFNNYIWNLYEYGNQWIKLSDDCDYEHIIAMAAIKKWQEIEADGFDSNTYTFEITDEDLDYCLDNLYEFYYSYRTGRCRNNDCHKYKSGDPPKVHYTCNRANTHKHLIGQVTNYELIGGVDFALNKILKIPKRSDYSSDEEYAKAKSQFETDKDIYNVYVEYIYNELGTSTKIPDYENDREAQYRLLRMHQAGHGKKPSNPPTNIRCSVRHEDISETITGFDNTASSVAITQHSWEDITEHIFLDISWNAPAPEEYSKGKFVEITGYNVYAYDRSSGKKKLLTKSSGTSCSVDYMRGSYAPEIEYETVDYDKGDGQTIQINQIKSRYYPVYGLPEYTHIVVEAYNDGGKGPQSEPFYVAIK